MRCPNCHAELDITDLVPLNERQRETLMAVRQIARRDFRGVAKTSAVAVDLGYSERWTLIWLRNLEQLGLVERPRGKKSGWRSKEGAHTLVQLRVLEPAA
jgi:DNA-binding IscR family transcriptional regulator